MQLLGKLCFCAFAALPTAALPLAAHADVVTSYTLNGSFTPDPGPIGAPVVSTATGTVVIDSTTGMVESIAATITPVSGTPTSFDSGATLSQDPSGQNNGDVYYNASSSENGDTLELIFPSSSLVGYGGGELCDGTDNCPGDTSSFVLTGYFLADGSGGAAATASLTDGVPYVPASATPEPGSLLLLGTGMLGVFGAARRRLLS